jgi:hypothetical protein
LLATEVPFSGDLPKRLREALLRTDSPRTFAFPALSAAAALFSSSLLFTAALRLTLLRRLSSPPLAAVLG